MVNQSLTIHALRPSFAIIGSAFAMILSASFPKNVATGASESSVPLGKTSFKPVRKAVICARPAGVPSAWLSQKSLSFSPSSTKTLNCGSDDFGLEEAMSSKNFGVFILQRYSL
jgi:hypothetical protein